MPPTFIAGACAGAWRPWTRGIVRSWTAPLVLCDARLEGLEREPDARRGLPVVPSLCGKRASVRCRCTRVHIVHGSTEDIGEGAQEESVGDVSPHKGRRQDGKVPREQITPAPVP